MKLDQENRSVQRVGVIGEGQFKIAASAHAFDILSSKLYTNVPEAIVRELSTNASDAHIEAGNANEPFDVHLPNYLEPWFSIRDYGTGLSPADVENTYTVYFQSTRGQSNDFTGALGLGSKSPFAYTDQFTVASTIDGRKYTYSLFKNERGEPSIALLGEQNSDDRNGLEINIPVHGDMHAFVAAAMKVYRWFRVRPNVSGATIEFDDSVPAIKGEAYEVYDAGHSVCPRVRVVMGQVCYDATAVCGSTYTFGHAARVVLHMEIGEVTIAASRESLQADDKTVAAINTRLETVLSDVRKQCDAMLNECGYTLERMQARSRFSGLVSFSHADRRLSTREDGKYSMRYVRMINQRLSFDDASYIEPRQDTTYFFIKEDEAFKDKHKRRIKHWIQTNCRGYNNIVFLVKIYDDAAFAETFGAVTINLSDLLPAPVNRSNSGPSIRQHLRKLSGHKYNRAMDNWSVVDESDLTNNGEVTLYAVPRRNSVVVHDTWGTMDPDDIRFLAQFMGIEASQVIGVSKNMFEKVKNRLDMVDMLEAAKEAVETVIANADEYMLSCLNQMDLDHRLLGISEMKIAKISTECDDFVNVCQVDNAMCNIVRTLAGRFGMKIPASSTDYVRAFKDRYPLIVALADALVCQPTVTRQNVIDYMEMVEALKGQEV